MKASEKSRHWDGVKRCYIPPETLRIDSSLLLSTEQSDTLDPITYEVVRNALVSLNFEHGALLQKLCISPIVIFARDFQTAVLTESGDLVCMGPNLQYFANCSALISKWILEFRSSSPGIAPGDIWMNNDPYVGSPHQPDTCLLAPIFVEGALFGWVTNILHYADVGGPCPQMNLSAQTIWEEAPSFPPMKIVEGGVLRQDIFEAFVRQSREPLVVATDMKAAIAACEASRDKLEATIRRYGAGAVKRVMNGMLDSGEALFRKHLQTIPDGTWTHRSYLEQSHVGDYGVHRIQISITKQGDTITVTNSGTDPQAGNLNLVFGVFSGAIFSALTSQLASTLAGAFGGVYRCVKFDLTSGLILCPDHPAAVMPTGGVQASSTIQAAMLAVAKMVTSSHDPDVRALALGPSLSQLIGYGVALAADSGETVIYPATDGLMSGISAMPGRDGIDAGGHSWIPDGICPNVEDVEQQYPLLYLYRRLAPGGPDGAGRTRSGRGFEMALMPHGAQAGQLVFSLNESFTKAQAPWGGNPGGATRIWVKSGADAAARMADGQVVQDIAALPGELTVIDYKPSIMPSFEQGDLWGANQATLAGWGDPLLRDPSQVEADFAARIIDPHVAAHVFGVVLTAEGRADETATEQRRRDMRSLRLGHMPVRAPSLNLEDAQPVGDCLHVKGGQWHCGCGEALGPLNVNYKQMATLVVTPLAELGASFNGTSKRTSGAMEFREFLCPACGTRIDTEIARRSDPILWDVRLETETSGLIARERAMDLC